MGTLGSCIIANELSPLGKELIQMRIDGQSWAQIAENKGLGSPGSARKLFTKETGLTDYKIKSDALKIMLENGYDPKATAAKIKEVVELAEKEVDNAPAFVFHKPSVSAPTETAKQASVTKLQHSPEQIQKVVEMYKKKATYTQIVQQTGLGFADVDTIVWNDILGSMYGSVPDAFLVKPTSQNAIQAMKDWLSKERAKGKTTEEISQLLNDKYGKGQWQVGKVKALLEKDVQWLSTPGYWENSALGGYSGGSSFTTFTTEPKITAGQDYPLFGLADAQAWSDALGQDMTQAQLAAMRSYTGSGYATINDALRYSNPTGATATKIKQIDEGMRPIPKDVTLIRKVSGTKKVFGVDDLTGMEGLSFSDPGYMSTAVTEGVWHGNVEMIIQAPAGTMGRYVKPFSMHASENEVILARNTEMVINEIQKRGPDNWVVLVTVIVR